MNVDSSMIIKRLATHIANLIVENEMLKEALAQKGGDPSAENSEKPVTTD